MSEAETPARVVEYKARVVWTTVVMGIAVLFAVGGAVCHLVLLSSTGLSSHAEIVGNLYMATNFIAAVCLLALASGTTSRNRCRIVMETIGVDYSDPPLDEWRTTLEDQGLLAEGGV